MKRRYDLDWLRVIAFALLMLFHTGMLFSTWSWHVKNLETSDAFDIVMRFLHQWRMPLLFFISGSAIWFAMDRYSAWQFFLERHKRLLIPLVFGMLVIIPPQVYYERLYHQQVYDSFGDFYRTLFALGSYPEGNLSWHHLWYIPYIWTYSMLALPLFIGLRSSTGRRILARGMKGLESPWLLFLAFIPSAVTEILLRPYWPEDANNLTSDWANFAHKLTFFLAGFAFASSTPLYDVIATHRRKFLFAAVAALALLEPTWTWRIYYLPETAYRVVQNINIWMWLLAVLGYGRRYLCFNHTILRYANEAVYPFYILHQTVIIILGYYLVPVNWSIGVKFCVVVTGTFLITGLLYALVIRPWNILRVGFGMKWMRAKASAEPPVPGARPRKEELAAAQTTSGAESVLNQLASKPVSIAGFCLLLLSPLALSSCHSHTGTLVVANLPAPSLTGNRLGIPDSQLLAIYLPPSYSEGDRHYPVLYFLPNFHNFLWQYTGGDYQRFRMQAAMDAIIASGEGQEVIVAIPNVTHFMGGSCYRNSPLTGNWEDFVTQDVVGYMDSHYRTIPTARARGLAGNGIGGTGVLEIALKHPDRFSCVYAMSPAVFDTNGMRDFGLPNERLERQWQSLQEQWSQMDDTARRHGFRDFIQVRMNSPSRRRFFDGLHISYAAAMTPDLNLPYPYIAFPKPVTAGAHDAADQLLLSRYASGFGGWADKAENYLALGHPLRSITLECTQGDEYDWIPRGTEDVCRVLREKGITCQLVRHEGGHETSLGWRLKTAMLPAMSKLLNAP